MSKQQIIYNMYGNVIEAPDLTTGELVRELRIKADAVPLSPEKPNWEADDYEDVYVFYEYTPEQAAEAAAESERFATHQWLDNHAQEEIEMTEDAVADVSELASDQFDTVADLSDAFAELSELVSNLLVP